MKGPKVRTIRLVVLGLMLATFVKSRPPEERFTLAGHVDVLDDSQPIITATLYYPKAVVQRQQTARHSLQVYADRFRNFEFGNLEAGSYLVEVYAGSIMIYQKEVKVPTSAPFKATGKVFAVILTSNESSAAERFVSTGCDATLWAHVYHPQRLTVIKTCIAVTGIIQRVKREPDGDAHIQLKLDPQFEGLLNNGNITEQAGCLVLEPICHSFVTQPDALAACRDFHSAVKIPPSNSHVRVRGTYVQDSERPHRWMEIHPVTSIEVVQ